MLDFDVAVLVGTYMLRICTYVCFGKLALIFGFAHCVLVWNLLKVRVRTLCNDVKNPLYIAFAKLCHCMESMMPCMQSYCVHVGLNEACSHVD